MSVSHGSFCLCLFQGKRRVPAGILPAFLFFSCTTGLMPTSLCTHCTGFYLTKGLRSHAAEREGASHHCVYSLYLTAEEAEAQRSEGLVQGHC